MIKLDHPLIFTNDNCVEEDILLAARYFESLRKKTRSPEERLVLALLENGIEYFQKYIDGGRPREKKRFTEAETWIMQTDPENGCFSFENVCEILRLDPDYVRKGVRQWQIAHKKARAKVRPIGRAAVRAPVREYSGARMVGT
jgi:hypothetical protein